MIMKKDELESKVSEWILEQRLQEYQPSTLNRYESNVKKFIDWLPDGEEITKEMMISFKAHLGNELGSTNTINTYIVEVNKFIKWTGEKELCLKKIKTTIKHSNEDVLSLSDYKRLLRFAKRNGDYMLYYVMKILAMTGIRIAELKFFQIQNFESNYIKVFNKGKERTIIVRQDLMRELKRYAREQGIKEGFLFPSPVKPKKMIDASTIWKHMKKTAGQAKIKKSKVHAHSFRHLFAQVFLETYTDSITELADILGHNSLETTRLYSRTSDAQKRAKLERMNFSK